MPNSSSSAVEKVIAEVKDLAVLPQVVYRVIELTGHDQSSAQSISAAITVDPGFSAKVLKLANSAYYSLPKPVTSIRDAVLFLGVKEVRMMAMSVGVFDLFLGKTDEESLRRRAWWRRSIDTAACAKHLAERFRWVDPEEAYTAGLLHLIGKTLLDRYDSAKYTTVMQLVDLGVPDLRAEATVFGCDHVETAETVAVKWGFPKPLVDGLHYHEAHPEPDAGRLNAVVACADRIATLALAGVSPDSDPREQMPEWLIDVLDIDWDDVPDMIAEGRAAIQRAARLAA